MSENVLLEDSPRIGRVLGTVFDRKVTDAPEELRRVLDLLCMSDVDFKGKSKETEIKPTRRAPIRSIEASKDVLTSNCRKRDSEMIYK